MKFKPIKLNNPDHPSLKAYAEAMEQGKHSYFVAQRDQVWVVKKQANVKATRVFPTKHKAISYAKDVTKSQNVALYVHDSNGEVKYIAAS